jgi:hypothetical protein
MKRWKKVEVLYLLSLEATVGWEVLYSETVLRPLELPNREDYDDEILSFVVSV